MGPKKVDDGVDDEQAERHTREYGRIPRRQGLRSPVANATRAEEMDMRYGKAPGKESYREGGEMSPEASARRMSGEDRLPPGQRPRYRNPRFVSPDAPYAPGREVATRAGGAAPPAVPPTSRAMTAAPEPRPPAQAGATAGREVATRQAPQVPQRGPTVVPEGARFVPSERIPNAQIAGPAAAPAAAAPAARSAAGRLARGALGPAMIALDVATPTQVAPGTIPPGFTYDQERAAIIPTRSEGEPGSGPYAQGRMDDGSTPRSVSPPIRDADERRAAPAQDALPVPPEFVEPPPRRRRMTGSVRPGRMSEADELNEMSLRAARGERAIGTDPREARIRAAMGMKKGGAVGGKECYSSGGKVGRKGDGLAKRGRTKGRFC